MQSPGCDIADELRRLSATYQLNSVELASLLRGPDQPKHAYPSAGIVRTVMGRVQPPSERFCALVVQRSAEIDAEIAEGVQALLIAGRLRRVFRVLPTRHIVTLLKADEFDLDHASPDDIVEIVRAAESVPAMWIHRCIICQGVFVARSARQHVCRRQDERGRYPCKLEADRRYHAAHYVKIPRPRKPRRPPTRNQPRERA